MEKERNKLQVTRKALLKAILVLVVTVFLLVNAVVLALRYPTVQTWAVKKASAILSETLQHKVTVGKVDIEFFKTVQLQNVRVLDQAGNELFFIARLDADIEVFSLFEPARVDFKNRKLVFKQNKLALENLKLVQPHVKLVQYAGTDSLNLSTFIASLNQLIQSDTSKPGTFEFSVKKLQIENGWFVYHNQNKTPAASGLDYAHLDLRNIYLQLSEIDLKGDTIAGRISNLRTIDKNSGVPVHKLSAFVTYAPTFWQFEQLDLHVAESNVGPYVRFDYNRFGDFTEFIDSVRFTGNFYNSKIVGRDIAQFAPQVSEYDETVYLRGKVKGKVKDFEARDLDIKLGRNTHVIGNISMAGLPDIKETFIELNLDSTTVNAADFRKYIPDQAFELAGKLGTISLQGQFIGFYSDFVANGRFNTSLGNLVSDINVKIDKDRRKSSYSGYLKTEKFNLGKLINQPQTVGLVTMNGKVSGTGFTLNAARAKVDVNIGSIDLLGYTYRNIVTNSTLGKQVFNGTLSVNDPNLKLDINGSVDLQPRKETIDIKGRIANANLKALKLTEKPLRLATNLEVDFTGLALESMQGTALFNQTSLLTENQALHLDSLKVSSYTVQGQRQVQVSSDLVSASLTGNFQYQKLVADVVELYKEYRLNFENNQAALNRYYARKKDPVDNYKVNLEVNLHRANPLLELFFPELSLAANTHISATYSQGFNNILNAVVLSDTILYNDLAFYKNQVEVNTSKLHQQPDILAQALFTSEKQNLTKSLDTEDLYLEGVWNNRRIDFSAHAKQTSSDNKALIAGNLSFLGDKIQLTFANSYINLLSQEWRFREGNTVTFQNNDLLFDQVVLASQNQSIGLNGIISKSADKLLHLKVTDFELASLNALAQPKIFGTLNASLEVKDLYEQAIINSAITVDSFLLDSILIGQISARSNWNNRVKQLEIDVNVLKENQNVLSISGYYNPNGGQQQLNMTAVLNSAPLKMIEPVVTVVMHDLSGSIDGRIRISGTPGSPLLKGTAFVTDGRFNLTYLNTVYTFTDKVILGENEIGFRGLKLTDPFGNTATVNGGIFHDGFTNMVLDLRASYRRFLVLNTTRANNPLYYGSAVATGNVSVLGAADNLKINVNARSEKGTRIFIPLDNTSELARQDFIRFVNRNNTDSTQQAAIEAADKVDLSGINLDFNLDVTDDAIVEIIFDERTGDIMRGAGNGRLRMNIDTRGEFTMYGQIEIARGSYAFSLFDLGLVTREFQVRQGGTISWNGDPYQGQLNLTATYTQYASLAAIDVTGVTTDPSNPSGAAATGGRYPVMALINLKGDLLNPQISLGLEFLEYPPEFETSISLLQSYVRNNEQELNNQVFSLLVLKRLSPINNLGGSAAGGSAGAAIGNSVGELLSAQLAQFLSEVDNNLEIDFSVGAIDQQSMEDIRVRLSYTLLSGRLQVTRQGAVGSSNTTNSTGAQSNAAGDWTVEYYLSKDGKYRLRMQYETTVSQFENANTSSTSISILQTQRFDAFSELFRRKKPKKSVRNQVPVESEKIILDNDIPIEL